MRHVNKIHGYAAFEHLASIHSYSESSDIFINLANSVRSAGALFIYEARAGTVSIDDVIYDPNDEDGYFWVGSSPVDASALTAIQAEPGIWLLIDRWADDICLSLDPRAALRAIIEGRV